MEKIIAVVIMIVIVIALIATVVMPQSQQVANMGENANTQMDQFQMGMQDGKSLGSAVIADFKMGAINDNLIVVIDDDSDATKALLTISATDGTIAVTADTSNISSDTITGGTVTLPTALTIDKNAVYQKSEKINSNNVRHVLYVRVNTAQ
ncbi:MAG TPA: hypothetical protein DEP72_01095 [Clostridiales bacterium]|nr:MAG: hypothetical protein A2Y18_01870 [Clostridiales bacterium GWD2_32_19]HCC06749.1 hypothetical protein [Clostridiales bacterium]